MKNKTYAYDSLGERIKTEWIIYFGFMYKGFSICRLCSARILF